MPKLFKPTDSPFYKARFRHQGKCYTINTKCASHREAEKAFKDLRDELLKKLKDQNQSSEPLSLGETVKSYMILSGNAHVGKEKTQRQCDYLIEFFGANKLITDINHMDACALREWRRLHVVGKHNPRPIG